MTNLERKQIASDYYDNYITDEILSCNPSWKNKKNFINWCYRRIKSPYIKLQLIDDKWISVYYNLIIVNLEKPLKKTKKK